MPIVSGLLDGALGLWCLWLALPARTQRNAFVRDGLFLVALAAIVGGFRLAGFDQVRPIHEFLTRLGKGPASLLFALGVVSTLIRGFPSARSWGMTLFVVALGVLAIPADSRIESMFLLLGLILLAALITKGIVSALKRDPLTSLAALGSAACFVGVAFGVRSIPFPKDFLLQPVDVVHLLLMGAYGLLVASIQPRGIDGR
jgi:hypothetical protein